MYKIYLVLQPEFQVWGSVGPLHCILDDVLSVMAHSNRITQTLNVGTFGGKHCRNCGHTQYFAEKAHRLRSGCIIVFSIQN